MYKTTKQYRLNVSESDVVEFVFISLPKITKMSTNVHSLVTRCHASVILFWQNYWWQIDVGLIVILSYFCVTHLHLARRQAFVRPLLSSAFKKLQFAVIITRSSGDVFLLDGILVLLRHCFVRGGSRSILQ